MIQLEKDKKLQKEFYRIDCLFNKYLNNQRIIICYVFDPKNFREGIKIEDGNICEGIVLSFKIQLFNKKTGEEIFLGRESDVVEDFYMEGSEDGDLLVDGKINIYDFFHIEIDSKYGYRIVSNQQLLDEATCVVTCAPEGTGTIMIRDFDENGNSLGASGDPDRMDSAVDLLVDYYDQFEMVAVPWSFWEGELVPRRSMNLKKKAEYKAIRKKEEALHVEFPRIFDIMYTRFNGAKINGGEVTLFSLSELSTLYPSHTIGRSGKKKQGIIFAKDKNGDFYWIEANYSATTINKISKGKKVQSWKYLSYFVADIVNNGTIKWPGYKKDES